MEAEQIRGTLRNAGFTDAQVEGLTAVLADMPTREDMHREFSAMWRNIALTMLAQTLVIIAAVAVL